MSTFREGKPEDSIEGATCTSCGRSDDKKTRTEWQGDGRIQEAPERGGAHD